VAHFLMKASPTTACFDNALEFLVQGRLFAARTAVMMMIPEAWAGNPLMDETRPRLLRISRPR